MAQDSADEYEIGNVEYSRKNVVKYGKDLERRIAKLGISDFYIYVVHMADGVPVQKLIQSFEELPIQATAVDEEE